MAEDRDEDIEEIDETSARPGKRRRSRKIWIILIALLVALAAGAGLYVSGVLDSLLNRFGAGQSAKTAAAAAPAPLPTFYDVPDVLANLKSAGPRQDFIKVGISLELESPLDLTAVQDKTPIITDRLLTYLRGTRLDDLRGSAGLVLTENELLSRINDAIKPTKIKGVLIKTILVQ